MGGRVDPGGADADEGWSDSRRRDALVAQLRGNQAPAPAATPSALDRLSTPAPWELRARAALVDLLRRASTPAPWEQAVSGQLGALLQHLRSTTSPEPPRP